MKNVSADEYVSDLIKKAKKAQKISENFSQEKVDKLCKALAWVIVKEENKMSLAKMALEETGMGDYESKCLKIAKKIRGVLRDIKDLKSVGVIEEDKKKGIIKIAKPVGVIGAIIPCTQPEITPVIKAMNAIKGRNAVIFSPHPRSKRTTYFAVKLMRSVLKKYNVPKDLLICIRDPSKEISLEIMKQCNLVIATGGKEMVKAAYSSGTPSYGVGPGNVVVVIDETADIKETAHKIMQSKTFDFATGCSCDNSAIIHSSIYNEMVNALIDEGGHLLNKKEKESLQKVVWVKGIINNDIIAKAPQKIAQLANIKIPDAAKFIMVEEKYIGKEFPFSGEKLSVILTLYKYKEFKNAIKKVNDIQSYQGAGHSCGIYSYNNKNIMNFCLNTKTSRVMVRQPQVYGNSGDWGNGMPFTVTLGCGTWGGNIVSENIVFKHYINTTWVSYPIQPIIPTDEELFGNIMHEF